MLVYPAVSWLSDSTVQLESKRQAQETPKGCVVTAEYHDEMSVAGSGPQKAQGEITCKPEGLTKPHSPF